MLVLFLQYSQHWHVKFIHPSKKPELRPRKYIHLLNYRPHSLNKQHRDLRTGGSEACPGGADVPLIRARQINLYVLLLKAWLVQEIACLFRLCEQDTSSLIQLPKQKCLLLFQTHETSAQAWQAWHGTTGGMPPIWTSFTPFLAEGNTTEYLKWHQMPMFRHSQQEVPASPTYSLICRNAQVVYFD